MMTSKKQLTHITHSTVQNKKICCQGGMKLNEKIYKTMARTGGCSVAVGIVTLVTGVAAGVLMIISGARLLKRKGDILI